jgi:hypothetical protein
MTGLRPASAWQSSCCCHSCIPPSFRQALFRALRNALRIEIDGSPSSRFSRHEVTSALGKRLAESRKSNNPKTLANVDLWAFLRLLRFSTPMRTAANSCSAVQNDSESLNSSACRARYGRSRVTGDDLRQPLAAKSSVMAGWIAIGAAGSDPARHPSENGIETMLTRLNRRRHWRGSPAR